MKDTITDVVRFEEYLNKVCKGNRVFNRYKIVDVKGNKQYWRMFNSRIYRDSSCKELREYK